jgi:1-acyl-sn-glycerol-3-phosphate acyltransferase
VREEGRAGHGGQVATGPSTRSRLASRWLLPAAKRVWYVLYTWGYQALRGGTYLLFRPLFRVRRIGPMPRLPKGGFVVCANHGSYLDPAFVQMVVPRRVVFMMTSTWYRKPSVRWFFGLVAAIPIDAGRLAHQGLRRGIDLLRRGRIVAIFPEGRLSRDGVVAPFQRGMAIMARMAGVPVVPLGIAGNMQAWPAGARRPRRADVRLVFGPAILWSQVGAEHDRDDEDAFAERVRAAVVAAKALADGAGRRRVG